MSKKTRNGKTPRSNNAGCTIQDAIQSGNAEFVKKCIKAGYDLNLSEDQYEPALFSAVRHRQTSIIDVLLHAEQIDLNILTKTESYMSWTPLHLAISMNELDIARKLIQAGSKLDELTENGKTPLHFAVANKNLDAVKLLIESKADVNKQREDKIICIDFSEHRYLLGSPLHYCLQPDNFLFDILKLLLNSSGDPNLRIGYFRQSHPFNAIGPQGPTVLHEAVRNCQVNAVEILLKQENINIEATDEIKRRPIHIAAEFSSPEILSMLIAANADLEAPGYMDDTPLALAVLKDNVAKAELLVKAGAKIQPKTTTEGMPEYYALLNEPDPLLMAVKHDNIPMVKILLKWGANINKCAHPASDNSGSPLHIACLRRNKAMFNFLLEAGRDTINKDLQAGAGHTVLHLATFRDQPEMVKALLKAGWHIDAKTGKRSVAKGGTAVHMAIHYQTSCLRPLLEAGANMEIEDCNGNTPICLACNEKYGSASALELLLVHGANFDVLSRVNSNMTPLEFILKHFYLQQADVRRELASLKALIACGYHLHQDFWLYRQSQRSDDKEHESNMSTVEARNWKKLLKFLKEERSKIPTLQHLCRSNIRNHLRKVTEGKSLVPEIKQIISVPVAIQQYLTLNGSK